MAIAQLLEHEGVLRVKDERRYAITKDGARWLVEKMQIDIATLSRSRAMARRCLDWTERRSHLAGALGAAFLERFLARCWVARTPSSRALRVTSRGREGFTSLGLTASHA